MGTGCGRSMMSGLSTSTTFSTVFVHAGRLEWHEEMAAVWAMDCERSWAKHATVLLLSLSMMSRAWCVELSTAGLAAACAKLIGPVPGRAIRISSREGKISSWKAGMSGPARGAVCGGGGGNGGMGRDTGCTCSAGTPGGCVLTAALLFVAGSEVRLHTKFSGFCCGGWRFGASASGSCFACCCGMAVWPWGPMEGDTGMSWATVGAGDRGGEGGRLSLAGC